LTSHAQPCVAAPRDERGEPAVAATITGSDHRPVAFLAERAPIAEYERLLAGRGALRSSAQIIHCGRIDSVGASLCFGHAASSLHANLTAPRDASAAALRRVV
jgi:hypothetical protein